MPSWTRGGVARVQGDVGIGSCSGMGASPAETGSYSNSRTPSRLLPLPLLLGPDRLADGHALAAQDARRGRVAVLLLQFLFELDDLIAQNLRPLEVQPLRGLQHLLVEVLHELDRDVIVG